MASDDKLRARIVAKLHRQGFYEPRGVAVDRAAGFAAASHDEGRAKELVREMAHSDDCPLKWKVVGEAVFLEQDSEDWAAAYIRRFDPDELPWNLDD